MCHNFKKKNDPRYWMNFVFSSDKSQQTVENPSYYYLGSSHSPV